MIVQGKSVQWWYARGKAWAGMAVVSLCLLSLPGFTQLGQAETGPGKPHRHLERAKIFLAAGDYRRAVEACRHHIDEDPSAASYLYLTYVYHAIDGYLEHLSRQDQWVKVGHLYLNLAATGTLDLVDPPDVLARIAKEVIQGSVRQQSDVTAAMAARLDEQVVARLWKQQTALREAQPDRWWSLVPEGWGW